MKSLKFTNTAKKPPPIDTPLLVVRKPDGMFTRKPYYCVVQYRRMGNAVDAMRGPSQADSSMFHDGKGFINKGDCPLWIELGNVPEIPA